MDTHSIKRQQTLQIFNVNERRKTHKRILCYFCRLTQEHYSELIQEKQKYHIVIQHIQAPFSPNCVQNQNRELKDLVSLIKQQIIKFFTKIVILIRQNIFFLQKCFDSIKLAKIDILSIFFQQIYHYYKATYDCFNIFAFTELQEFCQLNKGQIKKLYKFYKSHATHIKYNIFQKLTHMIQLLSLVKIKFKIHTFIRNHYKYNYSQLIQQVKQEGYMEQTIKNDNNQLYFSLFNFCQIFFLAGSKESKTELKSRAQIKQFVTINNQTSLQLQKTMIIKARIRKLMSFSSIFRILAQLRQNKQRFIQNFLKQDENYPLHLKFQFDSGQMFLKHNKIKKDVKTGIKYSIQLNKTELRSHLAVAAAMKYQLAKKTTFIQLSLEAKHQPLLLIQKFILSYRTIKKMPILNAEGEQKQKDLKATLILISTHERLLAFSFCTEQIDDINYFKILKGLIQHINIKDPFVTVLLENRIHQIMN